MTNFPDPPGCSIFAERFIKKKESDGVFLSILERFPGGVPDREVNFLRLFIDTWRYPYFLWIEAQTTHLDDVSVYPARLARGIKRPSFNSWSRGKPLQSK